MGNQAVVYYNPMLQETDPFITTYLWKISGGAIDAALTHVTPFVQGQQALLLYGDQVGLQAKFDSFLGTVDEFLVNQFTATNLTVNSLGVLLKMNGQAKAVAGAEITVYDYTPAFGEPVAAKIVQYAYPGTLANSPSVVESDIQVGEYGNMALAVVLGSTMTSTAPSYTSAAFSAITSGVIKLTVYWFPE